MAEFLSTTGTSYNIENLVISASKFLILICPYLKINDILFERLLDSDRKGVTITLVYGKQKLSRQEKNKLERLKNLNVYFLENLHAKCYCNETKAIISSMNLYEFSERNNREMSILIDKQNESSVYEDIIREINSMKNNAVIVRHIKTKEDKENLNPESNRELSSEDRNRLYINRFQNVFFEKYPDYKIMNKDEKLNICNFPFEGVDLTVDYILTFDFSKPLKQLKKIKKELKPVLRPRLENYRCYWNANYYNIRIYPAKDYEVDYTGKKIYDDISYFMNALDITKDFLLEYKSYFI